MSEAERLRASYEGILKHNPSNVEGVHYLAIWHLERQSFQQARKYFSHLASLIPSDPKVWLSLGVCCAMADELKDCQDALTKASILITNISQDSRIHFCHGLLFERQKDYANALDRYNYCINICNVNESKKKNGRGNQPSVEADDSLVLSNSKIDGREATPSDSSTTGIFSDLKGDAMLRIAIVHKETGSYDLAMQDCNQISQEGFSLNIRANALCLKGLLHELRLEYPASEVVYRSALQLFPGHTLALERLGRVYLRYRETIPAAVQCFIKSVEVDPSGHIAWYLLGRCYMATAQYSDAWEAYNRATNLNPNDSQVWCSLGVLYYSFGQYREALGMFSRAIKLDPTMSDAWYDIGALYDMCDQPEDAQKAYVKAKETGLAERFARSGINVNNPLVVAATVPVSNDVPTGSAVPISATTISSMQPSSSNNDDNNTDNNNNTNSDDDNNNDESSSFLLLPSSSSTVIQIVNDNNMVVSQDVDAISNTNNNIDDNIEGDMVTSNIHKENINIDGQQQQQSQKRKYDHGEEEQQQQQQHINNAYDSADNDEDDDNDDKDSMDDDEDDSNNDEAVNANNDDKEVKNNNTELQDEDE